MTILCTNYMYDHFTGSQDKEQMLKRLYEYVCDKTTATIKGEKVVSFGIQAYLYHGLILNYSLCNIITGW